MYLHISSIQEHRDRIAQLQHEIKKYDDASAHAKNGLNNIASTFKELQQNVRSSLGYKPLPEESAPSASTLNPKAPAFQNKSASADVAASTTKRTPTDSSDDGINTSKTDLKRARLQDDDEMQQDPAPQPSKHNDDDSPEQPSSSAQTV